MVHYPYIIALGGSAGGLEATIAFLQEVPVDTGAAFVIVSHLSRDYVSEARSILSLHTGMPVVRAESTMVLLPNHVYVMAENTVIFMKHGSLVVRPRHANEIINCSIDIFFHSMAEDAREKAVGIVLSGTGSDGAQGANAIHARGGMVMVQEPHSTHYQGMPMAAIREDSPDYILTPRQLAMQLVEYLKDQSAVGDTRVI